MIELKNISKVYDKHQNVVLNNINLKLPNKGLIIIKGKSGVGKTTLLNIIAGYDKPTSGTILGYSFNDISMMFQDYRLIDYLTVYENIKVVKELCHNNQYNIDELLKKFDIESIKNHYPNEISLGQALRVSLIRTLINNKPILLVDEPTKALDDDNVKIVFDFLEQQSKEKLVIVVSHDEYFLNKDTQYIEVKDGNININIDDIENESCITSSDNNLNLKLSTFLGVKTFLKRKGKYIFLSFLMFISFSFIIASLTGFFTSEADVIVKHCDEQGYSYAILDKNHTRSGNFISQEELDEYKSNNKIYECIKNVFGITINNVKLDYIDFYLMDEYNGNILNEKEVLLSSNTKDVLSINKGDFIKINNFSLNVIDFYNDGNEEDEVYSMIISEDTYKNYLFSNEFDLFMKRDGIEYYQTAVLYKLSEYDVSHIMHGEYSQLEENEIGLPANIAKNYTNDLESLIGNKITISICKKQYDSSHQETYDYIDLEFTVKYIYQESRKAIVLNEEVFKDLQFNYEWGSTHKLCVNISDKKVISKLINDGYTHDMFFSERLQDRIDYAKPFNYILLVVACVLLIFIISSFINFIISLISEDSNSIGILTSFGITKKKILIIYLIPVVLVTSIMIILSIFGSLGCLSLLTYVINYKRKVKYDIFFFNFKPLLCLLLLSLLIIALMYFILIKKLNKRTTIDLIYSRK